MKKPGKAPSPTAAGAAVPPLPEAPQTELGPATGFSPADVGRQLHCHFDGDLLARFEQLTGHRLLVLWHEPFEFLDPARPPVLCPEARARLHSGHPLSTQCAFCQRAHWCPLSPLTSHGRVVRGVCGAHGCWAGLQLGPLRPVTLVLHSAIPSSRFNHAVGLLHQVLRKVETALAAEQAGWELDHALRQPRLANAPAEPMTSPHLHPHGPRAHAVVQAMLDHLHTHYQRPLDLATLAGYLGMNASYLSSLFAATTGVRFHHFLSELRLAKAMELLRDPLQRICEIAAATGFASPNHFNNVFKTTTGVSPSAWRDAHQPAAPTPPPDERVSRGAGSHRGVGGSDG